MRRLVHGQSLLGRLPAVFTIATSQPASARPSCFAAALATAGPALRRRFYLVLGLAVLRIP